MKELKSQAAPVFVVENNQNVHSKKLNPLAEMDKIIQDLPKGGAEKYQTTLKMVETLLPVIFNDLNSGNFNNTARTFTLFSVALIPYGGVFISPIIGLLWGENTSAEESKIRNMMEELTSMMDKKIQEFDLLKLNEKRKTFITLLKKFETSINSTAFSDETDKANVRYADQINVGFSALISECQTPKYEIPELPVFTLIATAHLQFLYFLSQNILKNPRIKIDPEVYKRFYPDFKETAKKYKDYIKDINHSATSYLYELTNGGHIMTGNPVHEKVWAGVRKLDEQTMQNEAFLLAANPDSKVGFVKEGERLYFYSPIDNFLNSRNKECVFNIGDRVIGYFSYKGVSYLGNTVEGKKNSAGVSFKLSEIFKGWCEKEGYWYYHDPESGGITKGWCEIKNTNGEDTHWYFFDEAGSMLSAKKNFLIEAKHYDFDANGVCTTPDGY